MPKYIPPHLRSKGSTSPVLPSAARAENTLQVLPAAHALPVSSDQSQHRTRAQPPVPEWALCREAEWPCFVQPSADIQSELCQGSFWNIGTDQMTSADWKALCDEHGLGGWSGELPELLPMRAWDEGWVQIPRKCSPWHNPIVKQVLLGTQDCG